jgi:Glycine-zipper domain
LKKAMVNAMRMKTWWKFGSFAVVTPACLLILFVTGCNKKSETTPGTPATTGQASAPAAPPKAVPTFSAAQKVGLYVFPGKSQTHDQQLVDESECYDLAQQQSGVNPEMAAPAPPSSAEIQAAQAQGAQSAPQAQGGRVRGAARGAAGGAMIGAIAGDAGKGAAIGATVGTVRGGRQQRQANAASKEQAASQAGGQLQQQYKQQQAAYDQQIGNFKRAFSACLDSRGYSVK